LAALFHFRTLIQLARQKALICDAGHCVRSVGSLISESLGDKPPAPFREKDMRKITILAFATAILAVVTIVTDLMRAEAGSMHSPVAGASVFQQVPFAGG